MDASPQETQNLTKTIAVFIGWLSGSVGGIAAILYVFGYLSSIAQLNLIGLSGLVNFGHEHYLEEGGRFLISVVGQISEIVLNLFVLTCVIALPFLLLFGVLLHFWRNWLKTMQSRVANRSQQFNQRYLGVWQMALSIVLLLILLSGTEDPRVFNAPLEISGLLFNGVAAEKTGGVTQLLIQGNSAKLNALFSSSLLMLLKAGVLLYLAWELASRWRIRLLYIAPFVVIFLLYFLLLPMLYGVLQRQIRLPVVTLILNETTFLGEQKKLFLVNKSEREFVLWDAISKRVIWLPVSAVKAMEIRQVEPLFSHPTKKGAAP